MVIRLVLTGGTFDKEYNEITGELGFDKSHVTEMIHVSRYSGEVNISKLLLKDSLYMVQEDRDLIANACKTYDEKHIIITHGTDTMVETALTIQNQQLTDKVIVLTGAMVPFSFGVKSDAMFNFGNAFGYVQALKPGVYIAMNGHYFEADKVQKDKTAGRFIKKD
ncbi:MAG TPA: asparaginase domain-containing protein [Candidatus Saccharimonadales bacterium]|nr:asparaginase domain-containing protein [Candidatus Saccharimonadales bacterium]